MSLLQGNDSNSDVEGSDVDVQPARRPTLALAGVAGSALVGVVCLGLGLWHLQHPSHPETPESLTTLTTTIAELTTATTTTTTTTTLLPWNLPEFVEFNVPDDRIELGSPFAGMNTYRPVFEVPQESISTSKELESVSLPPKGEGLGGLTAFYRAATQASGYSPMDKPSVMQDKIEYGGDYGDIRFMLGEIRAVRRKRLADLSALKLGSQQRKMLVASPSDFIETYGRYFVSEIVYGIGFAAQCSADPSIASKYALNDVHDVFSESGPDLALRGGIEFDADGSGVAHPLPLRETEKGYAMWKTQADQGKIHPLRPIRVVVRPFADIPEIAEVLQGLPASQRELFEAPRIASTTATRLVDDRAKADYVTSALDTLTWECDKRELYDSALSYLLKFHFLDLPARQAEFNQGDYSWLKGNALLESLEPLMQRCSSFKKW